MVEHDFTEHQTATLAVIDAVAAASGTDPTELPPLYDAINPDALNALFESQGKRDRADLRVEFSYNGFNVIVEGDLQVTVREE